MHGRGAVMVTAGAILAILLPTLAMAGSGSASASYVASGTGAQRTFDQTTGEFHGTFAGGLPITFNPTTSFNIAGAVAQDAASSRTPIAICIGDITTVCSPAGCAVVHTPACVASWTNGVIGVHSVADRSSTAWPAGTPVNFWVLAFSVQTGPSPGLPAEGTSGTLLMYWN